MLGQPRTRRKDPLDKSGSGTGDDLRPPKTNRHGQLTWALKLVFHRLRVVVNLMLRRPVAALPALQEVVRLAPESAEAQLQLAQALGVLGRPKEAIEAYERALALDPTSGETNLSLVEDVLRWSASAKTEEERQALLAKIPKRRSQGVEVAGSKGRGES